MLTGLLCAVLYNHASLRCLYVLTLSYVNSTTDMHAVSFAYRDVFRPEGALFEII